MPYKIYLKLKLGLLLLWVIFFVCFYQNEVRLKKITILGKSYQFDTISYAQIVPIKHDSAMSY